MYRWLPLLVLAASATALADDAPLICEPAAFGARADGTTKDTAAIQGAIDACAAAGGGVVHFGTGTYLSAPLFLKTGITLSIDADAMLLASLDLADYQVPNSTALYAFINASNVTDIAITGAGSIDGQGGPWWTAFRDSGIARPRLIQLNKSQRIRFDGVTLSNSPSFHVASTGCDSMTFNGITIKAPADSPNTDGIDPGTSTHITISNSTFDVGDDDIAIKAGTSDVLVTYCTFLNGHGMSIGSETNKGGVHRITVQRCKFKGTQNGLRIKSDRAAGGEVSDVTYTDITMENVNPAISVSAYYPKIPAEGDPAQPVNDTTPYYHDIRFKNVTATGAKAAGTIVGVPEMPLWNIVLDNVSVGSNTGLIVRNAAVQMCNSSV
jgi:polygalacturonase